MTTTLITDHEQRGLDRIIEQYKEKPRFESLLKIFISQIQELEDETQRSFTEQFVDFAVGQQLDLFGTIVGLERQGFDDDFYRILLKVKIGQNISKGEPRSIINTFKLLTQATLVHYQNLGDAQISLAADTDIDPTLIDFFFTNMERVVMAGVRINSISCFDPDESFSFDGTGPVGLGFSSLAAPTTGGKFAFLHRRTLPAFAFGSIAGDSDLSSEGFGTLADVLAGGIFQGL